MDNEVGEILKVIQILYNCAIEILFTPRAPTHLSMHLFVEMGFIHIPASCIFSYG